VGVVGGRVVGGGVEVDCVVDSCLFCVGRLCDVGRGGGRAFVGRWPF
jgi:hypothetical protein